MTQPVSEDAYVTLWHLVLHFTSLKDNKLLRRHETTHASTIDIHQRICIDYISLSSLSHSLFLTLSLHLCLSLSSLALSFIQHTNEKEYGCCMFPRNLKVVFPLFFFNWDFSTLNWGTIVSQ